MEFIMDETTLRNMVPDGIQGLIAVKRMDKVASIMYDVDSDSLESLLTTVGTKLAAHRINRQRDGISIAALSTLRRG
jgi:hypothetical protein